MKIYKSQTIKTFVVITTIFCALCTSGCFKNSAPNKAAFETEFELSIDGKPFLAQIALSDTEKARGLMFRDTLKKNAGMVFTYTKPQQVSFWMKNTNIPLDIGFFTADGVLTEVKQMYPRNLDAVNSSRADIAYCIEMNFGWFDANKIFPPAKLDMPKLQAAIKARK